MSTTKFWDRINYIHGNRYLELISQLPVEKTEEFCAQITMNPIVQMRHIEEHPDYLGIGLQSVIIQILLKKCIFVI